MRLPTIATLSHLVRGQARHQLRCVVAAQEREVERYAHRPAKRSLAIVWLRRAEGRQRALGLD